MLVLEKKTTTNFKNESCGTLHVKIYKIVNRRVAFFLENTDPHKTSNESFFSSIPLNTFETLRRNSKKTSAVVASEVLHAVITFKGCSNRLTMREYNILIPLIMSKLQFSLSL